MNFTITTTETPAQQDVKTLEYGLTGFNEADVGPSNRRPLAVMVHDEAGALISGLAGYTAWGWLYVQWLWVAEGHRGRGMAGRMLAAAEREAELRGCHGAFIDTFNPKAETVYQRAGYEMFGTLPDFPMGRRRVFLQKRLVGGEVISPA